MEFASDIFFNKLCSPLVEEMLGYKRPQEIFVEVAQKNVLLLLSTIVRLEHYLKS